MERIQAGKGMKQYGDITKLSGYELDPVDLIVGGSPCQDLSVAGKRAGLDGERSGLFMEMIRIIKEMRSKTNGIYPRFALWENVPGAFSSNKGADFSAVLGEFARIAEPDAPDVPIPQEGWSKSGVLLGSDWSLAWRTHDAQFWGKTIRDSRTGDVLALGTPQRRRRIALVVDLRGQSAPEILFERKSLSGNPEQSGTQGKGSAGTAADSVGETGKCLNPCDIQMMVLNDQGGQQMDVSDKAMTLRSESHGHEPIVMNPRPMSMVTQTDKAATLGADDYKEPKIVLSFQERSGKPGGGKGILIQEDHVGALSTLNNQAVCYSIGSNNSEGMKSKNPKAGIHKTDVSRTIDYNGGNPACNQGGTMIVNATDRHVIGALCADDHKGANRQYVDDGKCQITNNRVRRLTPLECERLQGYPDGWTDIPGASDSAKYKALGNSICLPFWEHLAHRFAEMGGVKTIGSLFDGIGGFPLCFKEAGAETLWTSEIEPFCQKVVEWHVDNGDL